MSYILFKYDNWWMGQTKYMAPPPSLMKLNPISGQQIVISQLNSPLMPNNILTNIHLLFNKRKYTQSYKKSLPVGKFSDNSKKVKAHKIVCERSKS